MSSNPAENIRTVDWRKDAVPLGVRIAGAAIRDVMRIVAPKKDETEEN